MKVSVSKTCHESNHTKIVFNINTNALNLLFPKMFDLIDKTIKLMTCKTQTVTTTIYIIIMHCSTNLYNSKRLYQYKQKKLTYLVYNNDFFEK